MTATDLGTSNPAPAADVLIAGAGPTGMLAACELLRRGISVRVVDSAPEPVPYSKALLLWPRTLDVLEDLGLLDQVPEVAVRLNSFRYYSSHKEVANVRFPENLASYSLPQRATEDLLRAKLAELGGNIERGVRLLALERLDFSGDPGTSDGVTAILEHSDGTIERATVPWLIGADGAGSAVRAQLGLGFTGATYAHHFVLADSRVEGDLAPDEAHYFQSPDGVLVIGPMGQGIVRFFASAPAGSVPRRGKPEIDLATMQRIVDERGPGGLQLVDEQWVSTFRVHRRQAEKFQLGRVFLIGDAAHVHSPAGGQGMNTGMQDAHNIAWKLAAVLHGEAGYGLLDSYTPERHAVAEQVVRDTDVQTRAWLLRHPAAVALRDSIFRLADKAGLIERFYAPVMAGRTIRYPAKESAALLEPQRRQDDRGPLRVGAAVPPELRSRLLPGDRKPMDWLLLHTGTGPAGLPGRISPHRVDLTGIARDTDFALIRPDLVVAARGRNNDTDRLATWLNTLFHR